VAVIFLVFSISLSLILLFTDRQRVSLVNSDKFRTFSCRCISGTPGRLQDAIQREDPTSRQEVSLSTMFEHLQSEEQSLFALEVWMREAAAISLSLLSICFEEIVQHSRPYTQEAQRLRSRRDLRLVPLIPSPKTSKNFAVCRTTRLFYV